MSGFELKLCPFCGGNFRWHYKQAIGQRMIQGCAKCAGCGCKFGDDLVACDDDDLRDEISRLVNQRCERTDEIDAKAFMDVADE